MKIAIISPDIKSEKALAIISQHLVKSISKRDVEIDLIVYTAGSPLSFLTKIKDMKKYDILHIQHEYNLLDYYGLPFFFIFPLLKLLNKKIAVTMHTVLSKKEKFLGSQIKTFLRKALYLLQNRFVSSQTNHK